MSEHFASQVHFRCAFDMESLHPNRDDWQDLVKRVRSWVADILGVDQIELAKSWFYRGAIMTKGCPRHCILETVQDRGDEASGPPRYWGCRVEHPCREFSYRRWRVDITITRKTDKQFRFALVIRHWISFNYLGEEPPAPAASAPRILQHLIGAKTWKCSAGSEPLNLRAATLRVGSMNLLQQELESSTRECPIVYVSLHYETGVPLVDVEDLARKVAGTAVVYVAESRDSDAEMEYVFARDFRCWGGMVRVYQPGVRFDVPADYKRHRFYTVDVIRKVGAEEVALQIVRACCWRIRLFRPDDVVSNEDIHARARLTALRTAADRKNDTDHKLTELIKSVGEDNYELRRTNAQQYEEIQELQLQVMEKDDELRSVRREFEDYKLAAQCAFDRRKQLESKVQVIENLAELPSSLAEMLTLVAALHSDKIVLTGDVIKTAESAGLDDKSLGTAWKCLWSIPTVLHPLFFEDGQPKDIESAYRNRTGFELALNEGRQTRKQSSLMALRKRRFNGQEIDITPHVKWGNKAPKCLRVHFAIDHEKNRLIIGHCGDHLENYSSQFRS